MVFSCLIPPNNMNSYIVTSIQKSKHRNIKCFTSIVSSFCIFYRYTFAHFVAKPTKPTYNKGYTWVLSNMAPPARLERTTSRLGVASTHCLLVTVKRRKPLILLDFTVVTLLTMYGFFLPVFIVFYGRN